MLRRFLPVLVLAFVVGSLFRLGNELGIPVLRMFGTQGIVIIGLIAAYNLKKLQTEDGLRRLDQHLKGLPADVKVSSLPPVGRLPLWLLEREGRRILVGGSDVANSVRGRRAARALKRHGQQLLAAAERLGLLQNPRELTAALVLLRKGVGERKEIEIESYGRPVVLVNPEGVETLVRAGS